MAELLALIVLVGGIVVGAMFLAFTAVKFVFKIALLPLKLVFLPVIAILFVVKFVVIAAIVAIAGEMAVAVIIPVIVVVALLAIPVALIGIFA